MYCFATEKSTAESSCLWAGGTGDPNGHGQVDGANRRQDGGVAQACASPTANPVGVRPQGSSALSAHEWSFPNDTPYNRDLSSFELWERSLLRSQHRREITELARKHAARRKGAAIAVSASMAAGPTVAPFAAIASTGGGRAASSAVAPPRSAVAMPASSLVSFGDTGEAVAAVQRQVRCGRRRHLRPDHAWCGRALPEALRVRGHGLGGRKDLGGDVQVQRHLRGPGRQDRADGLQRRRREPRAGGRRLRRRLRRSGDSDGPLGGHEAREDPDGERPSARRLPPQNAPRRRTARLRFAGRGDSGAGRSGRRRAVAARVGSAHPSPAPRPASTARPARATPTRARTSRHRPAPPSAPPSAARSPRRATTAAATATSSASSTRAASPRATPTSPRSRPPRAPTSTSAT